MEAPFRLLSALRRMSAAHLDGRVIELGWISAGDTEQADVVRP
jgi:hypothetical protein